VTFFVLYNMCNIGAVMHWCFDCTNKCHSNYFIYASDRSYGLDWIWVSI